MNVTGNIAWNKTPPYTSLKTAPRLTELSALPPSYTWFLIQMAQKSEKHQTDMLTWQEEEEHPGKDV